MYYEYYWDFELGLVYYTQDSGFLHIPWNICRAFVEHFKKGKTYRSFPNMKLTRLEAAYILTQFEVKGRIR